MARSERLYLVDMIEAAEAVKRFVADHSRDEFITDDLLRSAVLQKLMIIGEAAARLSDSLKGRYPEIDWRRVVAFRNIAAHEYFAMNWSIAWIAATENAPELGRTVQRILDTEFPDSDAGSENDGSRR